MPFFSFNPFNTNSIDEIQPNDLTKLKDIPEGWHIDYKRELWQQKDIAKFLSAFANQYGGWLFFGIDEDENRCAGEFVGIEKGRVEDLLLKIREAATANVNPEIYYQEKVIWGPVESIDLDSDKAVVMVYVPEGANPPYLHSSGRIFRRLGDQSKPLIEPETRRFAIDELVGKRRKREERIKEFIFEESAFLKNTNYPVIYVNFFTNPFLEKRFSTLSFENFLKIIKNNEKISMESIHSFHGGYLSRQISQQNYFSETISFKWFHSGNCRLTCPISVFPVTDFENVRNNFEWGMAFLKEVDKNHQMRLSLKVGNFNKVVVAIGILFDIYRKILSETNNGEPIKACVTIRNCSLITPFVDSEEYLKQLQSTGIPMITENKISVPRAISPNNLLPINSLRDEFNEFSKIIQEVEELPNDWKGFYISTILIQIVISGIFNAVGIANDLQDVTVFQDLYLPSIVNRGFQD